MAGNIGHIARFGLYHETCASTQVATQKTHEDRVV